MTAAKERHAVGEKKYIIKIKTQVMSWISLQTHNVQKAKEATDPQNTYIHSTTHMRSPNFHG